jgi:hypothetical protein
VGGGDLVNKRLGGEEESPEMTPLSDMASSVGIKKKGNIIYHSHFITTFH